MPEYETTIDGQTFKVNFPKPPTSADFESAVQEFRSSRKSQPEPRTNTQAFLKQFYGGGTAIAEKQKAVDKAQKDYDLAASVFRKRAPAPKREYEYAYESGGIRWGVDAEGNRFELKRGSELPVGENMKRKAREAVSTTGGQIGSTVGTMISPLARVLGTAGGGRYDPNEAAMAAMAIASPPHAKEAAGAIEGAVGGLRKVAMKVGEKSKIAGKALDVLPSAYQKVAKPLGRMQEDVVVKRGGQGAVQEQEAASVLQRKPGQVGEAGGQRVGVQQGVQGEAVTGTSKVVKPRKPQAVTEAPATPVTQVTSEAGQTGTVNAKGKGQQASSVTVAPAPEVPVKTVVAKRVKAEPVAAHPASDPVTSLDWVMSEAREKQARAAASKIQAKLTAGQKVSPSDWEGLPPEVGKELATKLRVAAKTPPLQEMASGLDPRAVVRMADNLDLPSGSFRVERPPADAGLGQTVRSPLSIVDAQGKTIQSGYYERVGGPEGKQASQRIRGTQQNIERLTRESEHRVNAIEQRVLQGERKLFNKAGREKKLSEFIDLVEKDKTDPTRKGATPELQKALEDHDKLTDEFRDYIVKQRRELGIETPDDWGITEKGYYRHLFLGDIKVMDGGKQIGLGRTYNDAQKIAMDYLKQNPNAELHAVARDITGGDPTLRLSNKQFWRTVGKLADSAELSKSDILEDIRGTIGRKASKQKFAGFLQKRMGTEGYSKAYGDVMRLHGYQVARTQELSKLNRDLQPMIEGFKQRGQPGLAEHMESHLSQLWGTPSKLEQNIGQAIENTPALRNHVANPTMALRSTVQKMTALQSFLKLHVSPKSALVNAIQPFSTLWPYVSTKEFAAAYADLLKPSTRNALREAGVFQGATKLEGGNAVVGKKMTLSPFTAASQINRGMGYIVGKKMAAQAGLPAELQHLNGLAWAEKVEFDNSQWNAPPILRSPQGRLFGQFKGFTVKNLETLGNMAQKQEGDGRLGRATRLGKFGAAQVAAGGINSGGLATKAAGGYLIYKALKSSLESAGMDKDTSEKTADAIFYGAPSLLGADLSGSLALFDPFYGQSTTDKIVNFFGGPTTGTGVQFGDALYKWINAKDGDPKKGGSTTAKEKREKIVDKFFERLSPGTKVVKGVNDLAHGRNTKIDLGGSETELNKIETVLRAMGFTPKKQSKFYDARDYEPKKSSSRKKAVIQ